MSSWIKHLDLDSLPAATDFNLHTSFTKVADIIRTPPGARRKTVITFQPTISQKQWKSVDQWIYLFVIDGKLVKIGGTRTGLLKRTQSYLCGHHTADRGKSGTCSVTNAHIYNTLDQYIEKGSVCEMFAFLLPRITVTLDMWGASSTIVPQVYTAYETKALESFKTQFGRYPVLSDNSDPTHRE